MEITKIQVDLISMAPILFGAPLTTPKKDGEKSDTHEDRVWRDRMHLNADGHVFIPPLALKNCLSEGCKFSSKQIAGKGKETYTKHMEAGILVIDELVLSNGNGQPIDGKDVDALRLFVPSDGKKGGGKKVWKNFPCVPNWRTTACIHVLDPVLRQEVSVIERYLSDVCGPFIGLGAMRVRNNGITGRFRIENFKVTEESL